MDRTIQRQGQMLKVHIPNDEIGRCQPVGSKLGNGTNHGNSYHQRRTGSTLLQIQVEHITRTAIKAYLTGYAITSMTPIIRLLLQRTILLIRARFSFSKAFKSKPSIFPQIFKILKSSVNSQIPLFLLALIGGFTSFDVIFWYIARRYGYYPPPIPLRKSAKDSSKKQLTVQKQEKNEEIISEKDHFDTSVDIYGPRSPSPLLLTNANSFDDIYASSIASNASSSSSQLLDVFNNDVLVSAVHKINNTNNNDILPPHAPLKPSIISHSKKPSYDHTHFPNDIAGFDHVLVEDFKRNDDERRFAIALTPPHPRTRKRIISPTFLAACLSSAFAISIFNHSKRTDFALFTTVRALDSFASFQKDWIRSKIKWIPNIIQSNADSAIFILSCTEIMYSWFYYPEVLPKSYRNWINYMSHIDPKLLEVLKLFHDTKLTYGGTNKYDSYLFDLADKVNVPRDKVMFSKMVEKIPCTVMHGANVGCTGNMYNVWRRNFVDALKIYAPVHLLPLLLFRYRKLAKAPGPTLQHLLASILRSSSFLSTFVVIIFFWICMIRKISKSESSFGTFLGCFTCGFSIFLERKSRRREMCLYVIHKAIESIWAKHLNNLSIRGGATALFSISMGYLLSAYRHEPRAVRPAARGLIGFFLM